MLVVVAARARGRDDAAISGEAFNDARHRAAAAPFEETEREVLSGPFPHSTAVTRSRAPKAGRNQSARRPSSRRAPVVGGAALAASLPSPRRSPIPAEFRTIQGSLSTWHPVEGILLHADGPSTVTVGSRTGGFTWARPDCSQLRRRFDPGLRRRMGSLRHATCCQPGDGSD